MYFIDRRQIDQRLQFIPFVAKAMETMRSGWDGTDPLMIFAQERALHLAIEIVTDVGSMIIDGFLLRDASSYADIIEVLRGEGAFTDDDAASLTSLVDLRRLLVQQYIDLPRGELHPLTVELPPLLDRFSTDIQTFIAKELR